MTTSLHGEYNEGLLDEYIYDLPEKDDCWHLDDPRVVHIKRRKYSAGSHDSEMFETVGSYMRVGINARNAWKLDAKGAGTRVVILDNGVDYEHPSLRPAIEPVLDYARDFDHSSDPKGTPPSAGGRIANRFNAHGTACAGLVGARELYGSRVIGVAPEVHLVPIRISTNFRAASLINALRYAREVGHVILLPRFLPLVKELTDEVRIIAREIPVVCAAGNSGTDFLVHPACLEETIAVGACNDRGYRSTFSQYGENLDVVAPSNDLAVEDHELIRLDTDEVSFRIRNEIEREARINGKDVPTVRLPRLLVDEVLRSDEYHTSKNPTEFQARLAEHGDSWNIGRMGILSIATTDNLGDFGYNFEPAGDYCKATGDFGFGGTSAAAAQVAGVIALMLSKNAKLTAKQIRDTLRESARVDCLKDESGRSPDKPSKKFGYGLVNATEAIGKV